MARQDIIRRSDIRNGEELATRDDIVSAINNIEGQIPVGIKSAAYKEASEFVLSSDFAPPKHKVKLSRKDCVWVDGYIKIIPAIDISSKRIIIHQAIVRKGHGDIIFDAMISYPRAETYNGSVPNEFYIRDRDNQLTEENDFEYIQISYNIESIQTGEYINYDLRNAIGENVIQEESQGNEYHSNAGKQAFLSVFPTFESLGLNVIESCKDLVANRNMISSNFEPKYSELRKANLYITPYASGAIEENRSSNPEILKVSAHGYNTFNRVNITNDPTKFLQGAIAVGACDDSDVIDSTTGTTYGYGLEFFEDYRTWEAEYPNSAWLAKAFSSTFDNTRKIMTRTAEAKSGFLNWRNLKVGDVFRLGTSHTDASKYVEAEIASIDSDTQITFKDAVPALPEGVYIYHNCGPGVLWRPYLFMNHPTDTELYPHQQSPVCAVIGAKLKKIKLLSGLGWQVVREAAVATAKKTVGGVFGIHPWDMYRGFGIIQVDDAIAWINANYKSNEHREELAYKHNMAYGINPAITYDDLLPDSPMSKKHFESITDSAINVISLELKDDMHLYLQVPDVYEGFTFKVENGNLIAMV